MNSIDSNLSAVAGEQCKSSSARPSASSFTFPSRSFQTRSCRTLCGRRLTTRFSWTTATFTATIRTWTQTRSASQDRCGASTTSSTTRSWSGSCSSTAGRSSEWLPTLLSKFRAATSHELSCLWKRLSRFSSSPFSVPAINGPRIVLVLPFDRRRTHKRNVRFFCFFFFLFNNKTIAD